MTSSFKPVKFPNDKASYIAPSWEKMGEVCFSLAKKILKKNLEIDRLIALAKGGWTWARTMADFLKIEEVGSIQVQFYSGIYKTKKTPIIIQSLPLTIKNEKVLLFDDIDDSGETLITAEEYLQLCGVKQVTTATLFHKPWSKAKPDFYGGKTKSWVVFPHEVRETVEELSQKWKKQAIKKPALKKRLAKIGLSKEQIAFFLK